MVCHDVFTHSVKVKSSTPGLKLRLQEELVRCQNKQQEFPTDSTALQRLPYFLIDANFFLRVAEILLFSFNLAGIKQIIVPQWNNSTLPDFSPTFHLE